MPNEAIEKSLAQVDLAQITRGKNFHPSPVAWEDEVFYFLMLDRFSDGNERGFLDNHGAINSAGTTPLFTAADRDNAIKTSDDAARLREAGTLWCGGTPKGVASKIGYLPRLGITALWVSPSTRSSPRCSPCVATTSRCGAAANICARFPATASTTGFR